MIDIHTHILPFIDDGSSDLELSLNHLRSMSESGINRVYLTSHYFRGHYQYNRVDYMNKFNNFLSEVRNNNIDINLQTGFEVFIQPNIINDIVEHQLTLGDSNYVLLETELNGIPDDMYENVYPLLRKGYKPILAHAERYVSVLKNPKSITTFIERDIYIQINTGSLLGGYGEKVKEAAWTLLFNGWVHFLGSDDHVRGENNSYLIIKDKIIENIDEYTFSLLSQEYPEMIFQNKSVPYSYVYVPKDKHHHHKKRNIFRQIFR